MYLLLPVLYFVALYALCGAIERTILNMSKDEFCRWFS